MSDDTNDEKPTKRPPTVLGWIVRVVSLTILAVLVGVIVLQIAKPAEPPTFSAEVAVEDVRQDDGQWLIPVDITNEGTKTARVVTLEIDAGGQASEVELDMIGEAETATFVVPAPGPVSTVDLKVVSFEAP